VGTTAVILAAAAIPWAAVGLAVAVMAAAAAIPLLRSPVGRGDEAEERSAVRADLSQS
jgi:hypothetical protein